MSADYKAAKEAFVSGNTGSSILHVNLISFVALSSISLYSAVRTRLDPAYAKHMGLLAGFGFIVVPALLSVTILADKPGWTVLAFSLAAVHVSSYPIRPIGTPLPSSQSRPSTPVVESYTPSWPVSTIPVSPALTVYRGHMLLMTMISILAVDFACFPRYLAKCETFGVSVMDLGVGSFVFSQGVVSAIPLLKNPKYVNSSVAPKFLNVVTKVLPVLFLGLVRVVLVKGTEYPEHITEYGVHWNFFITLALLPALQIFFHPLIAKSVSISVLAFAVGIAHQIGLSFFDLEQYVLNAPRLDIISANKEGIFSLPGYLAIHLMGLSVGTKLLPSSPDYFRRRLQGREDKAKQLNTGRQDEKTGLVLASYAMLGWVLLALCQKLQLVPLISRQMVNLSYIAWVVAFNTSLLVGYFFLDLWMFPNTVPRHEAAALNVPADTGAVPTRTPGNPPALLEAVNKNGLALFLVANLATGLTNLSMETMYVSDQWAMIILLIYAYGICAVAWVFRDRKLWML